MSCQMIKQAANKLKVWTVYRNQWNGNRIECQCTHYVATLQRTTTTVQWVTPERHSLPVIYAGLIIQVKNTVITVRKFYRPTSWLML